MTHAMHADAVGFAQYGFAVIPEVLSLAQCTELGECVQLDEGRGGTRGLLDRAWCVRWSKEGTAT